MPFTDHIGMIRPHSGASCMGIIRWGQVHDPLRANYHPPTPSSSGSWLWSFISQMGQIEKNATIRGAPPSMDRPSLHLTFSLPPSPFALHLPVSLPPSPFALHLPFSPNDQRRGVGVLVAAKWLQASKPEYKNCSKFVTFQVRGGRRIYL